MNDAGKTIFINLNKTDVTKLQQYYMQQFIILHGTTTMTEILMRYPNLRQVSLELSVFYNKSSYNTIRL